MPDYLCRNAFCFYRASVYHRWLTQASWLLGTLTLALVLLNVVQTWQYNMGLIHCCEMTWEIYKQYFLKLSWPES
ncbi:hypothetical protein [Hymenobacter koreensis]|uniref:DUF418 domain-containing protein n=1 Tax=Hymenobacter koreensis TaxID=1084523 RepID=A0ABP8IY92_9BACT